MTDEKDYSTKSIQGLSDLEAMRMRPGMYIGSTESPNHLFQEAFDNSIDEVMAKHATKVKVLVDTKANSYTVQDNGSGIPMGSMEIEILGEKFVKQSLELLTSKGHVGGKFGHKIYNISGGLHGIGLKVMSAMSENFTVRTKRVFEDTGEFTEGKIVYSKGKLLEQSYTPCEKTHTGTSVTIIPDSEVFSSVVIPTSFIRNKCKIARAFGMDVSMSVDGVQEDLGNSNLDALIDIEEGVNFITKPTEFKVDLNDEFCKFSFKYTDDLSYRIKGFTNLIYNSQGGTHTRLFERAIIKAFRVLENDKHSIIHDWDFMNGFRGVVACFIKEIAFSSQTKERLTVPNGYLQKLMDMVSDEIVKYFNKNKDQFNLIYNKAKAFRENQNKLLNSKEIKGIIKVAEVKDGKVRRKSIVPKLVECTNPIPGETELFITEGDSALGSIKQSRDVRIHAGYPLRGKTLNIAWMPLAEALKNQEVSGIANSIGANIGEESDPKKSRYGKIIITADADIDGLHIQNLVICNLINLVPNLVKAGMVYIAPGYLYGYYLKDGSFHGCDTQEEIPKEAVRFKRYKGLGALNPSEFHEFYMNKETRKLIRVEFPESLEAFNNMMTQSKNALLQEEGVIVDYR